MAGGAAAAKGAMPFCLAAGAAWTPLAGGMCLGVAAGGGAFLGSKVGGAAEEYVMEDWADQDPFGTEDNDRPLYGLT